MTFSLLQPAKEYPPRRPTSQFNPSEVGFSRRFLACALDIAAVAVPFAVIVAIVCATTGMPTGMRIQQACGLNGAAASLSRAASTCDAGLRARCADRLQLRRTAPLTYTRIGNALAAPATC
jgi:hypothetical protein